jgi:MFS family permease
MLPAFVAVFVAEFAMVFVAPLNGVIQADLHTTGSQLSWVTAIFFLPTAALELTFGVLGDLFGRKRLLVGGTLAVAAGASIGAAAGSIQVLFIGQAVAGIGAAIIFPTSLAIIANQTPQPKDRARGVALWTMGITVGAAVGPVSSGAIGLTGSYRWAYVAVLVGAVVATVLSLVWAPDSRAAEGRGLDLAGQVSLAVALTAILYGLIEGPDLGWGSVTILGCLGGSVVLFAVFIVIENRTRFPLLDLSLLKIPTFSGAALVALISTCGFTAFIYTVAIRVAVIQGHNSLVVGLMNLIVGGIPILLWPFFGRLLFRIQLRWIMVTGLVAIAVAQVWVSTMPITDLSIGHLAPPLLLAGFGFPAVLSTTSAGAVNVVSPRLAGMASATTNMVRDTGGVVGVAIASAIGFGNAATALPAFLAKNGVTGHFLAIVDQVAAKAGPVAVAHANLGPLSARSTSAAQAALWHGFALSLLLSCALSVVSLLIALIMIRSIPAGSRPEPAESFLA